MKMKKQTHKKDSLKEVAKVKPAPKQENVSKERSIPQIFEGIKAAFVVMGKELTAKRCEVI